MAKHTPKMMKATVSTDMYNYDVLVDKYSGNRYKVVAGPDWMIGREYKYGKGLQNRKMLTPRFIAAERKGKK